jgi:hypothetical protein
LGRTNCDEEWSVGRGLSRSDSERDVETATDVIGEDVKTLCGVVQMSDVRLHLQERFVTVTVACTSQTVEGIK